MLIAQILTKEGRDLLYKRATIWEEFASESIMGKVYYISKTVGLGLLVLAVCALATIIALGIAYDKERAKNWGESGEGEADGIGVPTLPTTPSVPTEPWDRYRLPDSLFPLSYNVTLWPRLEANADGLYIFTGHSSVIDQRQVTPARL